MIRAVIGGLLFGAIFGRASIQSVGIFIRK